MSVMYDCDNCKRVFDETECDRQTVYVNGERTTQLFCPYCGCEDIGEHIEESDDEA